MPTLRDSKMPSGRWEHARGPDDPPGQPDALDNSEQWMETLAWLMDRSIPLGGFRIGLDPILGLVPGVGDMLSGVISSMIIMQAHRAGLPRVTILRMVTNVAVDSMVGTIPFLGDAFDFGFKANTRNLELYRRTVAKRKSSGADWIFLAAAVVLLLCAVLLPVLLITWVVRKAF